MPQKFYVSKKCESLSSTGDNSKFDIHTDVIKCTAFPDKFELPKPV